ncbi:uncharacterized protein DS421_4g108260 [Arachis hypogaea]|nr:uncharacterized protein DS421_9g280560 [Arachis hypogaea]QHO37054.1 uncharacterized protein DS421_4g108260 [Arachis hypogaea]
MANSSSSPSKKTQTTKFRATFQTEETFELVANNSRNHQQNIIQVKMEGKNQAEKNQIKDLKCATHLLSEKFRNMSEEK